jgi:hypothetical protein
MDRRIKSANDAHKQSQIYCQLSLFQLRTKNLAHRGMHSGCDPKCGANAVLPRGFAIRAGAASGIIPFGTTAEA